MTHHDFRPAWERLSAVMGFDELDDNGPPITAPRSVPPVRRDADTIEQRNRALAALARIRAER
jgi:hypothetical protein